MRTSSITIPFPDAAAAAIALAAIAPDNEGFVDASVEGADLRLQFEAETAMGLLRSIDDVLGCLRSIEQASK